MITKQEVLNNIEEVKKYINEAKIEIKNRWTGDVIYTSSKTTMKEAVEEAVASNADLSYTDLSYTDLSNANISKVDLSRANLFKADLFNADLSEADLFNAKFYGKGGTNKLKKSQVADFLKALGFIIE